MGEIRFNLIDNALDFIEHSLEIIHTQQKDRLKYSVLHLSAGVELIMKVRLEHEHWSLLFQKLDTADYSMLEKGDFISVDSDTSIKRLEKVCRIQVDPQFITTIKKLRKLRNQIEHFSFVVREEQVKAIIVRTLYSLLNFIDDEISKTYISEEVKKKLEEIKTAAHEIEEFLKEKYNNIKKNIKIIEENGSLIFKCPNCSYKSVVVDDGVECYVCETESDSEEFAENYVEEIMLISKYECGTDGGDFPVYYCPDCGNESFVMDHTILKSCFCTECGTSYSLDCISFCETCSSIMINNDFGMCSDCITYRISRYD